MVHDQSPSRGEEYRSSVGQAGAQLSRKRTTGKVHEDGQKYERYPPSHHKAFPAENSRLPCHLHYPGH
jgi:hypothetical protein